MRLIFKALGKEISLAEISDLPDFQACASDVCEFLHVVTSVRLPSIPSPVSNFTTTLGIDPGAWPLLVTSTQRQSYVDSLVSILKNSIQDSHNRGYLPHWAKIRSFLNNLSSPPVDQDTWRSVILTAGREHDFLSSDGLLLPTHYVTDGTSTGRLTVDSGPNFLTLPKEFRTALRPSKPGNVIANIDFSSFEPRVVAWAMGIDLSPGDVYEGIAAVHGLPDRATAKLALLSALYGASLGNLTAQVGSRAKAQALVGKVKEQFKVDQLEARLRDQANQGLVRNALGRPLREAVKNERVRINHFVQSTAAELAAIMFSELCDSFSWIKPLVVIHDALIVEVPGRRWRELQTACENVKWDGHLFPTKCEAIFPRD